MVVALVSALPSSPSSAAAAAPNSNAVHGMLLMANALLQGLLGVARGTATAAASGSNKAGGEADEEAAAQLTTLLVPLHDPAFLRALAEDKGPALVLGDQRRRPCPPLRLGALQLLLACHQLVATSSSSSSSSTLLSLLRTATQRVLTEQGLLDPASEEGGSAVRLPPVPGLAALVAWVARWHVLFSLRERDDDAAAAAAAARLLARGLGQQGLLEVRRESLRVLLLLLGRRAEAEVDLGEGSTEDEKHAERRMMAWQADRTVAGASAAAAPALWAEAAAEALVAQVQREENPNLLKGQLAALCLLLGSSPSSAGAGAGAAVTAPGAELWVFVARLARAEGDAADDEGDTGEIAARALELLGHLLPAQDGEEEGMARRWLRRVECAARPEGRSSLRMAALRSVAASGLLRYQCNAGGDKTVQSSASSPAVAVGALLAVLRLAHDDDDDVRTAACALLAASLVDPSGESDGMDRDNNSSKKLEYLYIYVYQSIRHFLPRHALPRPPGQHGAGPYGGGRRGGRPSMGPGRRQVSDEPNTPFTLPVDPN